MEGMEGKRGEERRRKGELVEKKLDKPNLNKTETDTELIGKRTLNVRRKTGNWLPCFNHSAIQVE